MTIANLHDLFIHTLQDVYFAEKTMVKSLPKMAKAASCDELKALIDAHLAETKGQVARLDKIFKLMGLKATAEECPAIEGIVEEAEGLIEEIEMGDTLDAAIIAVSQAAEHYEICRYGTLIAWGRQLGLSDAVALLQETLAEESGADKKLSALALDGVNAHAHSQAYAA